MNRASSRCSKSPSALVARLFILCAFTALAGCGDDAEKRQSWPDGWLVDGGGGGGGKVDGRTFDLGLKPDGLPQDPDGPKIDITSPKATDVVVGNLIKVTATITDPDGIDDQSVTVEAQGQAPVKMTLGSTPNVYEGLVDLSSFGDQVRVIVRANDLNQKKNSADRVFKRDPGPTIQVISPAADSRHKGSVSIKVQVSDSRKITKFEVSIAGVVIKTTQQDRGQGKFLHTASVKFDDAMFSPPLSGKQFITFDAQNENGARSTLQRTILIDDEGPSIKIDSQNAGQLIGGIIQLQATVNDPAEVVPSSVRVVIGNNLNKRSVVLRAATGSNTYTGQFDTRTLTQTDLWPVMSFRAADKLGNESHVDIQVGLDNGAPIIELDPGDIAYFREKDKKIECSHPFDPVGSDAADDGDAVPQVTKLRARVEDRGNDVPSAPWIPISGTSAATVRMYVLDDTSKALVIDTDGDGYCDAINPEVVPLGSAPSAGQAVAVNLTGITPNGSPNFTAYTPATHWPVCRMPDPNDSSKMINKDGTDTDAPKPLCKTTTMTVFAYAGSTASAPAIYAIPPVTPSTVECAGLPFDFAANNFTDKSWVCVAVSAADLLGNKGVSKPIRLYYDRSGAGAYQPYTGGTAPDCTGTLDTSTGRVDNSKPCKFRDRSMSFPQVFASPLIKEQP